MPQEVQPNEGPYQRLTYDVDAGVATIRLTRVESSNAMDMASKRELAEVVARAAEDDEVRAVVITGTDNVFCAGGDVVEMALNDNPVRSRSRLRTLLAQVFLPLAEMEKPIGLVNKVLPAGDLDKAAHELATELAAGATVAFGMAKTLLARSHHLGARDLAEFEAFGAAIAFATEDNRAAQAAFATKTVPVFAGK